MHLEVCPVGLKCNFLSVYWENKCWCPLFRKHEVRVTATPSPRCLFESRLFHCQDWSEKARLLGRAEWHWYLYGWYQIKPKKISDIMVLMAHGDARCHDSICWILDVRGIGMITQLLITEWAGCRHFASFSKTVLWLQIIVWNETQFTLTLVTYILQWIAF